MILRSILGVLLAAAIVSGCSGEKPGSSEPTSEPAPDQAARTATAEVNEIMPGLTIKKLQNGYGRAAVAGDYATVHYTGWLYDESAPDGRGEKFDSSVDRGQVFEFPLGEGRVIKGHTDEGSALFRLQFDRSIGIYIMTGIWTNWIRSSWSTG